MKDLISREAVIERIKYEADICNSGITRGVLELLQAIVEGMPPAVDAVEAKQIKAYLQSKLDEWNALGDRKFEPANMWGYNFIMACFDDLARMDGE